MRFIISGEGFRAARLLWIGCTLAGVLAVSGCGASEESMSEEDEFGSPDDAALTSFIGEAPKQDAPPPKEEPVAKPAPVQAQPGMTELESLRTENTSLKQKIVKLEQDTRTLNARVADLESKLMAEKDRADRAEEAARVAAQSAALASRSSEPRTARPSGAMMSEYEQALRSFNAKQYDNAIAALQGLLDSGVSSDLADNCVYWIGESYFGKRNFAEAAKHFEGVFRYTDSEKLADAQFMLAQSYDRMGNKARAKEAYERVVKDFPTSNHVQRAKDRWARL